MRQSPIDTAESKWYIFVRARERDEGYKRISSYYVVGTKHASLARTTDMAPAIVTTLTKTTL
jgi:hypothetical protein